MTNFIRGTVITFNVVMLIGGLAIAGLGVYIRVDKSQIDELIGGSFELPVTNSDLNNMMGSSLVHIAAYLLMATGGFIVFIAFLGCCGALTENKCLLVTYSVFLVIIFLAQVAGAVLAFLFYDNIGYILEKTVGDVMIDKYRNEKYRLITKAVDALHQEFQCCGFSSPYEWKNATSFNSTTTDVPRSCCKDMNLDNCNEIINDDLVYDKGCMTALTNWLKDNVLYAGAVTVSVAVIQLFGIAFALCLCKKATED